MQKIAFTFSIIVLFFSCGSEENELSDVQQFVSEKTIITDEYPVLEDVVTDIMEQLQICTNNELIDSLPPCSNKYFRIFDHRPTKPLGSGFIVEMIPGLYNSPVHQIVIIEESLGSYKIVNQYLGFLIEMRTTYVGYSDLLIGYTDPDIGIVAIKHIWKGKKYEPVDVEEINNHFVKPELKDSINNIFLPAFSAGH